MVGGEGDDSSNISGLGYVCYTWSCGCGPVVGGLMDGDVDGVGDSKCHSQNASWLDHWESNPGILIVLKRKCSSRGSG